MKTIFLVASFLLFCHKTMALDLMFDLITCTQACGLTPNTSDSVSMTAIKGYDFRGGLNTQCQWRGMKLQKEIVCNSKRYDYSNNEAAVRCNQGINTSPRLCRVTVKGYGFNPNGRGVAVAHGDQSAANYNEAVTLAMQQCRSEFAAKSVSVYQCYLGWYAPNARPVK